MWIKEKMFFLQILWNSLANFLKTLLTNIDAIEDYAHLILMDHKNRMNEQLFEFDLTV